MKKQLAGLAIVVLASALVFPTMGLSQGMFLRHHHHHHRMGGLPIGAVPPATFGSPVYTNPGYTTPVYTNPGYTTPVYGSPAYSSPIYSSPIYSPTVVTTPGVSSPSWGFRGRMDGGDRGLRAERRGGDRERNRGLRR